MNILNTTKIIKNKQPKNIKHTLTASKFGEHTTHGVSKYKYKRCGVCNIIMKGKLYTFENKKNDNKQKPEPQFKKCSLHNWMLRL